MCAVIIYTYLVIGSDQPYSTTLTLGWDSLLILVPILRSEVENISYHPFPKTRMQSKLTHLKWSSI